MFYVCVHFNPNSMITETRGAPSTFRGRKSYYVGHQSKTRCHWMEKRELNTKRSAHSCNAPHGVKSPLTSATVCTYVHLHCTSSPIHGTQQATKEVVVNDIFEVKIKIQKKDILEPSGFWVLSSQMDRQSAHLLKKSYFYGLNADRKGIPCHVESQSIHFSKSFIVWTIGQPISGRHLGSSLP